MGKQNNMFKLRVKLLNNTCYYKMHGASDNNCYKGFIYISLLKKDYSRSNKEIERSVFSDIMLDDWYMVVQLF